MNGETEQCWRHQKNECEIKHCYCASWWLRPKAWKNTTMTAPLHNPAGRIHRLHRPACSVQVFDRGALYVMHNTTTQPQRTRQTVVLWSKSHGQVLIHSSSRGGWSQSHFTGDKEIFVFYTQERRNVCEPQITLSQNVVKLLYENPGRNKGEDKNKKWLNKFFPTR